MHQVYELNARTWRTERSAELGRQASLDDLDYAFLDHLVENGFTWLYLFGVWNCGPKARDVALADQRLHHQLSLVLPEFTINDIGSSPMAISGYTCKPELGGDAALERLRDRARASGLSLMLDFVPNHAGLDHPWAVTHPEFLIRGNAEDLRREPGRWITIGDHVFAHGRDPNFPSWEDTLQIDYANPAAQAAVIAECVSVAGRCDGLRCEEAMLLLPDVFRGNWGRDMAPFWRACTDAVRAAHPGTLFLAEVYWNKEYELQQLGFDFTYDKTLYDRLLTEHAESIRGHLRADLDYQKHSVRFLENDDEQRAAATFASIDHPRGALLLTGMVPGMLLCHYGQEDGRRMHSPHRARRRPPEEGSPFHRRAYRDLMHLLAEPARHDGVWQLLEPHNHDGRSLIGCLWTLTGYHSLCLIVNASWSHVSGAVRAGPLAERDCQFQDCLASGPNLTIKAETLRHQGIQVNLPPWGVHAWKVMNAR